MLGILEFDCFAKSCVIASIRASVTKSYLDRKSVV